MTLCMHKWVACFAVLLGCSSADTGFEDEAPVGEVSWHQDIAPIVAKNCQGCHQAGSIGPFSYETYEDAKPYAQLMADAVERGAMPPWGAVPTDDCTPQHGMKDDPRLTEDEKALLRAWADGGAPAGDPSEAAPVPEPMSRSLADYTHELQAAPWLTEGNVDQYRCFVLDPEATTDMWLTGIEVMPGSRTVVHHAVVTLDPERKTENLPGADGSYDCFGGGPGAFLGGYTPGAPPFEMPQGTAVRVTAGSLIVLNIHYHPLGFPGETDATAVRLRMSSSAPEQEVMFEFRGNSGDAPILQPGPNDAGEVEFRIPADATDHTETMQYTIPDTGNARIPIWSIFPHMHYVGVDMEVRVERANPAPGEPKQECLIKTSRYSFNWQRLYSYDAAQKDLPTLSGGDKLILKCTYDNSTANQNVVRALDEQGKDAPTDVALGESTLDEMCVGLFGVLMP